AKARRRDAEKRGATAQAEWTGRQRHARQDERAELTSRDASHRPASGRCRRRALLLRGNGAHYNPAIVRISAASAAVVLALLAGLGAVRALEPPRQGPCPAQPVPAVSAAVPADVCIPDGLTGLAIEQFDDYSWRAFVALVWPAAPPRRGVASESRPLATPGPRVFETFKALHEVFHPDGSAPA